MTIRHSTLEASDHDTCQKYVSEVVDVIRDRGYSL